MSTLIAHSPRFSSAAALIRHYKGVRRRMNSLAPPPVLALPSPEMITRGNPMPPTIPLALVLPPPVKRKIVHGAAATVDDIVPAQYGAQAPAIKRLPPDIERIAVRRAISIYFSRLRRERNARRTWLAREAIAAAFKVDLPALLAVSHRRGVVRARQFGMTLSYRLVGASLPQIGQAFGNRDHTTVLHGVRKMESLVEEILAEMYDGQACDLEVLEMVDESTDAAAKPKVRRCLRAHIRMSGGSSYAYDLIDETDAKVGEFHAFVAKSEKQKSSQSYFLGDREFATAREFLKAYYAKVEQDRRDAEWDAAAPNASQPEGKLNG